MNRGGGGGGTGVPWYLIFDFLGGVISDIWFFSGVWYLISDFLARYLIFLRTRDIIDKIVIAMCFYSCICTSNCVNSDHDKTMSNMADMIDIVTYGGQGR